jgi:RHS repeat-associated protein
MLLLALEQVKLNLKDFAKNQELMAKMYQVFEGNFKEELDRLGHGINTLLNQKDSQGNEGAFFSLLVENESLDIQTLQELKTEDDSTIVVFIDQSVSELEILQAGVVKGIEAITLSPDQDGIQQITQFLQKYPQITTIHIVSHGAPGCLYLGNSQLNLNNISDYREIWQHWPRNLNILLYGCNVAAGNAGEEFIAKLHQATGAKIAASAQRVGNPALGGGWQLEVKTSVDVVPSLAFSADTLTMYQGIFAPTLVGEWGYLNRARDVAVVGNYIYAVGDRLEIIDISNPDKPIIKANYKISSGENVQVVGNYAYIADGDSGLQIIDISDPSNLTLKGNYKTPGFARNLQVVSNYAYIADDYAGLQIIDITDPSNPTLKGNYYDLQRTYDVQVIGIYAYIANGYELQIIDISDSSNPTLKGSYITPGPVDSVHVVGDYAYVGQYPGLKIIDISNPSNPTLKGSFSFFGTGDVQVISNYAYVTAGLEGLQIIDINDPSNPTLKGSFNSIGSSGDVQVVNNYAYVAFSSSGVLSLDISNPSTPTMKGIISNLIDSAYGVQIVGNYAYIANGLSGLEIIDISDPSNPKLKGNYNTPVSAYGVQVVDNYAYIADGDSGLQIIDISDPTTPKLKSSYETSGSAKSVQVVSNYAYLADETSGLEIIDISDPSNPKFKGNYNTSGSAYSVQVVGSYAYVADESSGLQIIDISDPSNPILKGSYYTSGTAYDVQVVDNYAYIADGTLGLQIIDISDPSNPILKSSYDTSDVAYSVKVVGNYAYIADGTSGLQIIDISDPSNPTIKDNYNTFGSARSVQVVGRYAYVTDEKDGLKIIDVSKFGVTKPGTLIFSSPAFSVREDGTPITAVTVVRTDGSDGIISARINLKDGTAKAPSDYTNIPITVSFADGEISKTVIIPIVSDTTPELDETLQLILTSPTGGATIGQQNTATFTIVDKDSPLITGLPQGALGSNKGQTTIILAGQNFSPSDKISLIASSETEKAASKVYWVSETEAWATFDLQGLNTGKYDVKVTNGQNASVVEDAFTVTDGSLGKIQVKLSYQGRGTATVTYTNVGETDVVAPLLRISPTNAQVNYPEENTVSATLRQLLNLNLGISENGLAGILAPGESGEFSFAYTPNGNGLISFAIEQVNPNEVINWANIKAESRADYSFIDAAAWDAIWNNLTEVFGTTVGQFHAVMTENANYLSQLGQPTNDLTRLFAFEWKQAVNTLTNVSLISTTDVVDTAPGLSLTFGRTFYQSLAERYNLGGLGRGWASQWDLLATTDSQGNVVIRSVGDLQRIFEQQNDGTYTGNGGATITITNGEYRLKEANGLISLFGSDGKLNYLEDTNGNRITLQYTNNLLTKLVHTNGDSLTLTYNAQGRISQITDSTGQITSYSYDASGENLLSVTTPESTTTYTYDTGNIAAKKYSLLSVKTDLGYERTFEYDNQGRLIKEFSNGQTQSLTYSYDSVGGVTITDSTGTSQTILLDDRGNAGQIRGVDNQNLLFRYDANGNLISATLPNGRQSGYSYDSNGNLTKQTNLLNQDVKFTYDANFNQLTGFTDPKGNTVTYAYDTKGNLTKITYPDGSFQEFSVDGLGNVTSSINRRGNTIQYTYNNDGLLTKKQYTDSSSVSYGYDTRGNLTSVTDATGTITMQYNAANQITKITYPTGRTLSYSYNADGQRTQIVSGDGYTVNYSYDTVGRLKTLTDATGKSIISYDYDSAGRLIKETNGNGTYTTYEYDQQSQLTRLINYKADNTVNSQFEYTYDNLGRRTSMTTLEGTFQYGYDATGQLTSVVTPDNRTIRYQYDAAGNRIAVTDNEIATNYTTNNLNQYTNVGNAVYTYDKDGNLISKTQVGQTSTYTYDVENRLTKVVTPQGTWDYQYDGLGNRVATILNGQRTEYLLDPFGLGDIVGEYAGNGNLIANYTHGIGLVSRVNGSNSNYYDADALGSTVGLTANDGSYVNRYSYLPFGEDLTKVEGVANPFEYVGQWGVMDEGNGLDFMRARFYDPGLGRFTAVDPIGVNGGDTNLYRYGFNQPVKIVDPSGLTPESLPDTLLNFQNQFSRKKIAKGLKAVSLGVGLLGLAAVATTGSSFYLSITAISFLAALYSDSLDDGNIDLEKLFLDQGLGVLGELNKSINKINTLKDLIELEELLDDLLKKGSDGSGNGGNGGGNGGNGGGNGGNGSGGGSSTGDPHLITFDGTYYSFQAAGEFTLVKSTTDDFEIQVRQEPGGAGANFSLNTAIAIKTGGQRIAVYSRNPQNLIINGNPVNLPDGSLYAIGQNLIINEDGKYSIITANNDQIEFAGININLNLAANRQGKVVGLMGNNNGNPDDEFTLRDGTVIGDSISSQQLYGEYADSWRITQDTSLFDYASGEDTNTFTDRSFPKTIITSATISPEQRAAAEQIARQAGITDPNVLETAILDIILSNGDPVFIQSAVNQQRLITVNSSNTLVNPGGFGNQYWLTTSAVIPYTIRFTNNANVGITPVAQVTITQQLDSDLDFNTFTLNNFGFGDITINVPLGVQNYNQRLDLRTTRGVFVDVNAGLDTSTGVVTWTFTAIDPNTGNAVNSATQGFLPPNDQNGAGRGFVGYSIQPKANSLTTTRIDAQANITFNNQTPILTAPVFNTLDGDAPTSQVNTLPANSNPNFTVSWAGADSGSGIATYDIYVSTDGGQYVLWKDNITAASAIYNGQVGKTYSFYSVASDNLGLVETAPIQADATTTIVAGNNSPTVQQVIIDQTATEDAIFTFIIPENTFADIDTGDILTYSAILENGAALPSWLTFNPTNRTFSGTPINSDVGSLNIKVTATDNFGASANDIFTLSVANTNDAPILVQAIADQTAREGTIFSFILPANTFSDIDADDTLTYSATLENGNALPSWLTFNAATRTFSGTPTNSDVGSLNIKAIATDQANASVSDTFKVVIETVKNDSDTDGINDDIEKLAGDRNKDGIPDYQQANVASFFQDNSNANNLNEIITIVSQPGTALGTVKAIKNPAPNQPNDPEKQGISFPTDFLNFNLQGLTPGAATTVNLLLPNVSNNQAYNTYWKYGKTPDNNQEHWYEFIYDGETGAEFIDTNGDGKADQILLHFVDGKRGDSDLIANGVISVNGAPGFTNNSLTLSKINQHIWEIQGNAGAAFLNFSLTSKNTNQVNEVGVFRVDQQNRVNGIAPGEAGFAKAALEQGEIIFSTLADNLLAGVSLTRKLQFGAGERLAFYFIPNNTTDGVLAKNNFNQVLFSIDQANPNGVNYLQVSQVNRSFNLAWKQGNNTSFNNLVMSLQLDNTPLSQQNLIASFQGEQEGELLNLESFIGRDINVTFMLNREAAYDNFVGFYKIEDRQGTITDPLTGNKFKPGDSGYAELVVRLREPRVELSTANLSSVISENTLKGGYIYAPFIIANGNPITVKGDFSNVYLPFIQGNSDKVDHIRLLGDNIFGFEDLPGGGDNDFNDLIVQVKFTF